ncbi:hypothetical protein BO221_42350 [Archangium sp. Cb G35]|uniref:DUF3261 domain-containing protein n=1 Tax=Archangium sp. Cb G35 TaxID=1920190 RepID=UPI000935B0E2|nr:DUF3261 domain-containing protein [Archangium sp. Cb G35]OJT18132.1 hypothetical protein BO221_42350 [Archangium sp. Cb G35]
MRRLIHTAALLHLAACATTPTRPAAPAVSLPVLELSPAAFGETVSLAQNLSFAHDADPEGPRSLEALLEIDTSALRLAGFMLGRRVFTMQWDGTVLAEQRDPHVPAQLQSRQVLRDVQLVYWPAEALRSALPPGWTLEESPGRRALLETGREWVTVRYDGEPRHVGRAELLNHAEHYRLTIESRPADE